ncbi:hypothetical protein TNCV_417191 [Trichonephila clavipes]|nr:hypothetical protein TNCV_417191 [Trichonephila clavipes]
MEPAFFPSIYDSSFPTTQCELTYLNVLLVLAQCLAVGSLVVRASDSRPEGLVLMPDATKYPPSTHGVRTR